ncbi:MAG TPA: hypothetical protein VFY19_04710, partial [Geminicoccaceae bacterium]|nr:hypothetical protein [Geminicoccaceae bacterium]
MPAASPGRGASATVEPVRAHRGRDKLPGFGIIARGAIPVGLAGCGGRHGMYTKQALRALGVTGEEFTDEQRRALDRD